MIKLLEVAGIHWAIQGMRMSYDSESASDSSAPGEPIRIGPKDTALFKKLVAAGAGHRKFLRVIQVWALVEEPRYILTEMDTHAIGRTRLSASTMHKLGSRDLNPDDFQDRCISARSLEELNALAAAVRASKGADKVVALRRMKTALPEGYLQRSVMNMNYECLLNMYHQRKFHRLPEWSGPAGICAWIVSLPLMNIFIAGAMTPEAP